VAVCECIKNGDFKFTILDDDCKYLKYVDYSTWVSKPEEYTINILTPGSSVFKTVVVKTDMINLISSFDLGLSVENNLVSLPSGIYCITVETCGKVYQDQFLNLCTIKCELYNLLAGQVECGGYNTNNYSNCKKNSSYYESIDEEVNKMKALQAFRILKGAEALFRCETCSDHLVTQKIQLVKNILDKQDCNCL